jgi:hypothetical protein
MRALMLTAQSRGVDALGQVGRRAGQGWRLRRRAPGRSLQLQFAWSDAMRRVRCLHPGLLVFALAACSSPPPPAADEPGPARPASTVLDPQLQALDKARAAQKQIDDAAEARRKAIDDAGG